MYLEESIGERLRAQRPSPACHEAAQSCTTCSRLMDFMTSGPQRPSSAMSPGPQDLYQNPSTAPLPSRQNSCFDVRSLEFYGSPSWSQPSAGNPQTYNSTVY